MLQAGKVGTPLYTSPEVLKKQPFDFKVDMWALGCLLYYMACLEPPFNVSQAQKDKTAGGKAAKLQNKL
jgi:serine/threonine protein kinase